MSKNHTDPTLEEACVAKGMRMTDQRRVIAQVIEAAADHPDVEELYRRAAAVDDRISLSTVYRTVNLFEEPVCTGSLSAFSFQRSVPVAIFKGCFPKVGT